MQATDFFKYLNNPKSLTQQQVFELKKIVDEFPYFQSANILLSLASKKWDTALYQQTLKRTAITITNRSKLFELINSLEEVADEIQTKPEAENLYKEIKSETQTLPNNFEQEKSDLKEITALEENSTLVEIKNKLNEISNELSLLKTTEPNATTTTDEVVVIVEETDALLSENNSEETVAEKVEEHKEKISEESVEKELKKSLINAFIEKEVLDTPSLHHPAQEKTPETFTDWLLLLKKNNGQSIEEIEQQAILQREKTQPKLKPNFNQNEDNLDETAKKRQKMELIDKIIEKNPGSIRHKDDKKLFIANAQAKESLLENEHLVTETLAKIYAIQGNISKAIRAYEILSLKFPQKSVYFASQIKSLKENQ